MNAPAALPMLVALVLFALAGTGEAQQTGRDAVAGVWQLNFALTSTPPDIDAAGIDETPRPRAGMGGVGSPGGRVGPGRMGGGVEGGGQAGSRDRQRMRTLLRRAGDAPPRLTIVLDGARVLLTDGQGRTTTLLTNNRKQQLVTGDGEIDVRARWDGPQLLVEEDFGSRMKITYRYAALAQGDTGQLQVTVTISAGNAGRRGSPPPLTRLYDRAAS
jgi:hypothetical protein